MKRGCQLGQDIAHVIRGAQVGEKAGRLEQETLQMNDSQTARGHQDVLPVGYRKGGA